MKKFRKIISHIYHKLRGSTHLESSEAYISWLRKNGVKVGEGTVAFNPKNIKIDIQRPGLVEIGNDVFLHNGTKIFNHDWASWTFVRLFSDYIPSHSKVVIGNNVWFGTDVTVLKGVHIGDNTIIAAGSVVTKSIPPKSVAAGSPAKVICSIDEYYEKRKREYVDEAINYAISIYDSGRIPSIEDFYNDWPVFVDVSNYKDYPFDYQQFNERQFKEWLKNHKAPFSGFNQFMEHVNELRLNRAKSI